MNPDEPKPPAGAQMPEGLSPAAQKQWTRVAAILEECGLLTVADADALSMYCEAYARWKHANEQIARLGVLVKAKNSSFPVRNPYLSIADTAFNQMKAMISEFGMTPSSRTRVSKAPGTRKPQSRLHSVLGGKAAA